MFKIAMSIMVKGNESFLAASGKIIFYIIAIYCAGS